MDYFYILSVCLALTLVIIHGGNAALLTVCADNAACQAAGGDPNAVCAKETDAGGDTDGNCICTGDYKNNAGNDGCVEKAVSDYTCDPTSDDATNGGAAVCAAVDDNAECSTGTKKCACKSGYKQDTTNVNTCVKVLTETCASDGDCTGTVTNSECSTLTCSCVAGYKEVNNLCSKVLTETCASNGDCTGTVANSECSTLTCSCVAGYKEVNNLCIKAVSDYTCDPTSNDATNGGAAVCAAVDANAECPIGTTKCACKSGYKQDTTNVNTCVKAAESSATSAWMTTSMVRTSLLIAVLKLIY